MIGTDIPGSSDITPAPDFDDGYEEALESKALEIEDQLVSPYGFDEFTWDDINPDTDDAETMATVNDLLREIYTKRLLKFRGYPELQERVDNLINDQIIVLARESLK